LNEYFSNFKNLEKNFNLLLIIGEKIDLKDDIFEEILHNDNKFKIFNSNSTDISIIKDMT
jgi:hypothetical protein